MNETTKTRNLLRREELALLTGKGIDVGCGNDPVVPDAVVFDRAQGDAAYILRHLPAGAAYDYVYSSHCLEHLADPPTALGEWWSMVKPGGTLMLVVPDEDLYELGYWPSLFNPEHRATFTIAKGLSWSPVSHNLCEMVLSLDRLDSWSIRLQDDRYDRRKACFRGWPRFAAARAAWFRFRLWRRWPSTIPAFDQVCSLLRAPIDQTLGDAVAQILVVAKKRAG